jgi:L-threonylcarbamoyladenylate synthase
MGSSYEAVLKEMARGGVAVYPTETLYALGCSALDEAACRRVVEIKGREEFKPLPLIAGSVEQLEAVAGEFTDDVRLLAAHFWPGPLSVLVPAAAGLAPQVKDRRGMTSVRVTPHPAAAALCLELGAPLVATSANRAGGVPAANPGEIDPQVLSAAVFLDLEPRPGGGPPSTVVEAPGGGELRVLRPGAVAVSRLQKAGFTLI